MSYYTFGFEAPIEQHQIGNGPRKVTYTVIKLPKALHPEMPFSEQSRPRISGEIDGHPLNGAWQPDGNGLYYLMVPKRILKDAAVAIGDTVELRFNLADPDEVDVPHALADALEADPKAMDNWQSLTAGKRRGFSYRVASAKSKPTIEKRIAEVLHMVREGLSYGKGGKIK